MSLKRWTTVENISSSASFSNPNPIDLKESMSRSDSNPDKNEDVIPLAPVIDEMCCENQLRIEVKFQPTFRFDLSKNYSDHISNSYERRIAEHVRNSLKGNDAIASLIDFDINLNKPSIFCPYRASYTNVWLNDVTHDETEQNSKKTTSLGASKCSTTSSQTDHEKLVECRCNTYNNDNNKTITNKKYSDLPDVHFVRHKGHRWIRNRSINELRQRRTPCSKHELGVFLDFTDWFSNITPRYAQLTKPLREILKTTHYDFEECEEECTHAVTELKYALTKNVAIRDYDPYRDSFLRVHVSTLGVVATLYQKYPCNDRDNDETNNEIQKCNEKDNKIKIKFKNNYEGLSRDSRKKIEIENDDHNGCDDVLTCAIETQNEGTKENIVNNQSFKKCQKNHPNKSLQNDEKECQYEVCLHYSRSTDVLNDDLNISEENLVELMLKSLTEIINIYESRFGIFKPAVKIRFDAR